MVKFLSEEAAKTLSNKTAKRILKALDEKKSTSQIAKELNLPLTTVDYNMSQLKKAGLIKSGYYKWSKRGNKMKLYEPAGEIFVYAPEDKQPAVLEALNKFVIPVVLAVAGGFGYAIQKLFYGQQVVQTFAREEAVMSGAEKAAPAVADSAVQAAQAEPQLWFWFMVVAGLVLLVLYLFKLRRNS